MDEFDRAQELELAQREAAIAQASTNTNLGPVYSGQCHYCSTPLPSPRRFCDADCREGWDKEAAAKRRNGKPLSTGVFYDDPMDDFSTSA